MILVCGEALFDLFLRYLVIAQKRLRFRRADADRTEESGAVGVLRQGVTPLINAVSVVMLAVSMLLVLVSLLVQRRSRNGAAPITR